MQISTSNVAEESHLYVSSQTKAISDNDGPAKTEEFNWKALDQAAEMVRKTASIQLGSHHFGRRHLLEDGEVLRLRQNHQPRRALQISAEPPPKGILLICTLIHTCMYICTCI